MASATNATCVADAEVHIGSFTIFDAFFTAGVSAYFIIQACCRYWGCKISDFTTRVRDGLLLDVPEDVVEELQKQQMERSASMMVPITETFRVGMLVRNPLRINSLLTTGTAPASFPAFLVIAFFGICGVTFVDKIKFYGSMWVKCAMAVGVWFVVSAPNQQYDTSSFWCFFRYTAMLVMPPKESIFWNFLVSAATVISVVWSSSAVGITHRCGSEVLFFLGLTLITVTFFSFSGLCQRPSGGQGQGSSSLPSDCVVRAPSRPHAAQGAAVGLSGTL